jgi:hypothetical protein
LYQDRKSFRILSYLKSLGFYAISGQHPAINVKLPESTFAKCRVHDGCLLSILQIPKNPRICIKEKRKRGMEGVKKGKDRKKEEKKSLEMSHEISNLSIIYHI